MDDAALGHEPSTQNPSAQASPAMQRSSESKASPGGSSFHRDKISIPGIWNSASQPPHLRRQEDQQRARHQAHISYHEISKQSAAASAFIMPRLSPSSSPSRPWISQLEVVNPHHHQLQLAQAFSAGQRSVLHARHSSHGAAQASLVTRTLTPSRILESNSTSYIPPSTPRASPLPPSSASYLPPDKSKALPLFSLHMGGMSTGGQVNARKPLTMDTGCAPASIFVEEMRPAFSNLGPPMHIDIQTANSRDRPLCQQGNLTLYARGRTGQSVRIDFPGSLVSNTFASNLVCLRSLLILGWTIDWQTDQALLHTPDRSDTLALPCVDGMYIFPPLFIDPRYIQTGAAKTRQSPMTPPPPT